MLAANAGILSIEKDVYKSAMFGFQRETNILNFFINSRREPKSLGLAKIEKHASEGAAQIYTKVDNLKMFLL